eukprot:8753370-Alexandrium_andersonii.AAC.1
MRVPQHCHCGHKWGRARGADRPCSWCFGVAARSCCLPGTLQRRRGRSVIATLRSAYLPAADNTWAHVAAAAAAGRAGMSCYRRAALQLCCVRS